MRYIPSSIPVLVLSAGVSLACAGDGVWTDPRGDATIRRTDTGNDAPLPDGFVPIDLLELRVEGWETPTPETDPYQGQPVSGDADLMRIVLTLDGLVSPPGPLAIDSSLYNPYAFGDRPLFGYIEFDVDANADSGGEFMPQARHRYLANVGRFGMVPPGTLGQRMVTQSGAEIDTDFDTGPQFERTGGEFTLAMCGCFTPQIIAQDGDMDSFFDPGETWIVRGRFFERFSAFSSESGFFGGSDYGLFDPLVDLRFSHDLLSDTTSVTLIFPLTQEGAAALAGEPVEPLDYDVSNQTSIEEAIDDLIYGADFATGALAQLVSAWRGRVIEDHLDPIQWGATALIGTAPLIQDDSFFIWTDTGFGEVFGDMDRDGQHTLLDNQIILDTIALLDGTAEDDDGVVNGAVVIPDFGRHFDARDLNGDGVIDEDDTLGDACPADFSGDGQVDFFDLSLFMAAYNGQAPEADFNQDGVINFFDVSAYLLAYSAGCS